MKNYEQSLSTNIVSETQLGYAYQSHPATTAVCGNKSTNPMYKCYYFEPSGVYSFRKSGQYATGELSVTKTTDADNRTSLVFFRLARQ